MHFVLHGHQRCFFLFCQLPLPGKTDIEQMKTSALTLRQWKRAPVSTAANLRDLRGRDGSGLIFFRNGCEGILLTEGILEINRAAAAACCNDGTQEQLGFPGQTDEVGLASTLSGRKRSYSTTSIMSTSWRRLSRVIRTSCL